VTYIGLLAYGSRAQNQCQPARQEFDARQVGFGPRQAGDHHVRQAILSTQNERRLWAINVGANRRRAQLI
jgi:hypothetical protein